MTAESFPFKEILLPALVGDAILAFSFYGLEHYGMGVFMGTPFLVGMLASFGLVRKSKKIGFCLFAAVLSNLLMCLGAVVFALEGVICILMCLPLAAGLGLLGGVLGYSISKALDRRTETGIHACLIAVLPLAMSVEKDWVDMPGERRVTSRVEISGSPEQVWEQVVAFLTIDAEPEGVFRFGIAYPISARIEGQGVGATRSCTFSTGSFVEPITVWEPPRHLAFDVIENPIPLKELSFFGDIHPPHLESTFVSNRGEFRLREENGKTVLEGSTWYSQKMWPQWYWGPMTDHLIHRIHERVLEHIRHEAAGS